MGIKIEPGTRFNKLAVLNQEPSVGTGCRYLCRCDCGNELIVRAVNLRGGQKSCGCLVRVNKTHGMSNTRLSRIWNGMQTRCNNFRHKDYPRYGGRGIHNLFPCASDFYKWALSSGYNDDLTIERVNNDGSYSRDNCRWVTIQEQAVNRRTNKFITNIKTGERLCLADWNRRLGGSRKVIEERLKMGWDEQRAITEPRHFCIGDAV